MRHRHDQVDPVFDGAGIKGISIDDPEPGTGCVSLGSDFAIAERFRVKVIPDGPVLPVVTLVLEMQAGKPTCAELSLHRRGRAVSPAMLREIPLGAYLREAVAHGAFRYTRDEKAAVSAREDKRSSATLGQPRMVDGEPAWIYREPDRSQWDDVGVLRATSRSLRRQPRRGIPISDEELREIAQAYRERVRTSTAPSESLAHDWKVGTSTMKRWIKRARDAGYLDPARPGVAGG